MASIRSFSLEAMIFVGCAAFVAATTSIYPTTNVQADEGSTLAITCSFRKDFGQYQMSVNGDRTGNIIDLSAGNISRPLSLLTGFYIIRRVSPRVEVDFLVTASRAANEFRLRCLFVPTDKPEEGSYVITLTINYPPSSPSVKHEVFPVTIEETFLQFQLNCSELLTGNPLPDFNWTYDNKLTADVKERGMRHSILTVKIDSLEEVPALIYSGEFVCKASNRLGSANKTFILNVSAVPSVPRQVSCELSQVLNSSVTCTWIEPVSHGSSVITQYELDVEKGEHRMIYNTMFEPGVKDYSIPLAFCSPGCSISISAVNFVGSGPQSSDIFKAPAPAPARGSSSPGATGGKVLLLLLLAAVL